MQALDYLLSNADTDDGPDHRMPHLVLLDLKLPKVSGLEVLRRLREDVRTKYLPINPHVLVAGRGHGEIIRERGQLLCEQAG
jgi:CheY-like chemotaxis protein